MYEWHKNIQAVINQIDENIKQRNNDELTLIHLSNSLNYSPFYTTRKFKELTGIAFRDYLRYRKLAFALIDLRDTDKSIIDIAMDYGFSSHEAFTRAFKNAYGAAPKEYRENPVPVVLRTKINPADRYLLGLGEIGMIRSNNEIKIYYVSIPAHKFLHIKNYESNGYFDFWEKQDSIEGQDCNTICGLLDSMKGKLDGEDGVIGKFSGQIMGHIFEGDDRCAEAYGVRLPIDWNGNKPEQMLLIDVPEAEYIVFEHGPFDYENENITVGERLEAAVNSFDFADTEYNPDESAGRVSYFYHDPERFEKIIRPVKKK